LSLPAAKILVQNLIGDKDVAKFDSVSLSIDTVKRRIREMSVVIAGQVTEGLKFQSLALLSRLRNRPTSLIVANHSFMSEQCENWHNKRKRYF